MNWFCSFSQTDSLRIKLDLKKIRAELIQCDSIKVWFHNSKFEAFSLRNAIRIKEEQSVVLLKSNKSLYYANDQLKKDIEKEKRKKKKLAIGLGAGIVVVVAVAILSFLIK